MKILYLYAELMGYQIPVLREYARRHGAQVHVVHWDHKKLTPYVPPVIENVAYYKRSEHDEAALLALADRISPDIIFISGWQDRDYLAVAKRFRRRGVPVVAGFDDQWKGTARQWAASVLFPFAKDRFFSHGWVTGPYQYEFARRLGFPKNRILFNCYSADTELFNGIYEECRESKTERYPHRFLFAGRYERIKGVDILVDAWNHLGNARKDWELRFVGNGSMEPYLRLQSGIQVGGFVQPAGLVDEIRQAGCFILPSRSEPWAVVLHEYSAAGVPIVCSDVCGAAPVFVNSSVNGHVFSHQDKGALEEKMLRIIQTSDSDLVRMSESAHKAGQRITPEISAASFLSILG